MSVGDEDRQDDRQADQKEVQGVDLGGDGGCALRKQRNAEHEP